ncbi:aromatic ring-hydroxylating oxygenase subunit alpha [Caulobacter sp. KR2-114]|uniref:aromatic ring-hydroxylating oxygenase subunit alpha n=1 Tax=Caulobacter sp. KR2-114 TaxID=3400912 RepID=UPI003C057CDF
MPAPLTPADYVTAEAYACEQGLLGRAWTPVCRSEELAAAGAQRPVQVADTPILLTRDRDGVVRAMSNVCRHRGMILASEPLQAEVVRCPYHLWAFGLDGRLKAAPFMAPGSVSNCDLPLYQAGEWGGFVFVSLDPDAQPLSEAMAPMAEALQPDRLEGLRIGWRVAFEHAWNWKVLVENFGESYHHIGPHAGTLQPLWPGGQTDSTPGGPDWFEITHPEHPEEGALRVWVIFPLFLLATTTRSTGAVWYRITPTGPQSMSLEVLGLEPPKACADAEKMGAARELLTAVHLEDITVCDGVQAGLRSPDAILGPLSPLEAGVARFRGWIAASRARPGR